MTKRTQTIRRHVWTFYEKKNVKNKLPNKDTIIDYLLNEWITSKFSKSQESTDRSQSANIYESLTVDNSASDTIKDTNNEEKAAKKPRVVITGDLLLNDTNEKGLLKDNHVEIQNFHGGTTNHFKESWRASQEQAWYPYCACWDQWLDERKNCVDSFFWKKVKSVKRFSPQIKLVFSSLFVRKEKEHEQRSNRRKR